MEALQKEETRRLKEEKNMGGRGVEESEKEESEQGAEGETTGERRTTHTAHHTTPHHNIAHAMRSKAGSSLLSCSHLHICARPVERDLGRRTKADEGDMRVLRTAGRRKALAHHTTREAPHHTHVIYDAY